MKLKNKIYIIQIFITIAFVSFFLIVYNGYIKQKEADLESNIKTITQTNKFFIEQSLSSIYKEYQTNQKLFYRIHQYSQNEYLKNPNKNLATLKDEIKKQFNISDIDIDIYLIDKTYTITASTFQNDIGFNLSVIEDAKNYLDKTNKDSKIYVASNISIDLLDSNLNVYSYSKIDKDRYFEMGFKLKQPLYKQLKQNLETTYQTTNNKITLFRIIDTADKKEIYINLFTQQNENISKKEFEESLPKFSKDIPTTDKHINAIRLNEVQKEIKENSYIVYVPLLRKNNTQHHLSYNNILMKIEIDISSYLQSLENTKQNFTLFGLVLFVFLVILFYLIRYNFYKPMLSITQRFEKEEKITDEKLLNKTDEFGVLVEKYNQLYDNLKSETQLNSKLLEENKRFIADTVHQIRTPLTNIMMNGEMVKKFQKDDTLSLFIDQIDASINMLSNSYEDLAYITSYDTIEYKSHKIDLSEILSKRVKFFSTISKVNFKEIVSNIENDIYIDINEIECERIIDNNISNGIKYGTANQSITINLFKYNDTVILEFKTFGDPIKNKEKVFEKNYRENEAKRGLGLGLNMVKGICEKYGISYSTTYENNQNIFTYKFKISGN